MILVIDAGNSRIKWGVWADGAWQGRGHRPSKDIADFSGCIQNIRPDWVGVSCVAGPDVRASLGAALDRFDCPVHWLKPELEAFGVHNGYRDPASLGADRWANLVACRRLGLAPCVVASLGTAMTVDALGGDGRHLGGVILPGTALMREALRRATAGVAEVEGEVADFPSSTGDAVETGITFAQVGVVAGLRDKLATSEARDVTAVLTGGDCQRLVGRVPPPLRVVEDLALEGLLWVARDLGVQGS